MTARNLALAPIKACRDLVADIAAAVVARHPRLEPAFLAVGQRLWKVPGLATLYRRSAETLVTRLTRADHAYRRLHIGPFAPVYDVSQFTTRGLYFVGVPYEPETTDWLLSNLPAGGVFVDVGANHGYFTVLAALVVGPKGRVLAFEPNPAVFAQLREHVSRNELSERVGLYEVALSHVVQGEAPFFPSTCASNTGLSSLVRPAVAQEPAVVASAGITVRTETFDSWARQAGVDRVDGIKIDVEGAEHLVLEGMRRTLAANPPRWIICETSLGSPAHRLLSDAGYSVSRLDAIDETFGNLLFTRAFPSLH